MFECSFVHGFILYYKDEDYLMHIFVLHVGLAHVYYYLHFGIKIF